MTVDLPAWALQPATAGDRVRTAEAQRRGVTQIRWPESKALRDWTRQQGWRAPRLGFQSAFLGTMLASDANFALAITESGVEILIPAERVPIPDDELHEMDALYEERGDDGRPSGWGALVDRLREIRRVVEAGVVVEIDGTTLNSWGSFYTWAHGRYHMLEDGYDSWIGDDKS